MISDSRFGHFPINTYAMSDYVSREEFEEMKVVLVQILKELAWLTQRDHGFKEVPRKKERETELGRMSSKQRKGKKYCSSSSSSSSEDMFSYLRETEQDDHGRSQHRAYRGRGRYARGQHEVNEDSMVTDKITWENTTIIDFAWTFLGSMDYRRSRSFWTGWARSIDSSNIWTLKKERRSN